jgi:NitT/TauT family transport system ATP-binding protein
MAISLPHPRQRKSPAFLEAVDRVYATLAGQTQAEEIELGSAPGEPGATRALPNISINDLAGLLERLGEEAGRPRDIYRLAEDLHVDSDHLLHLTEAAELLGFAVIAHGDISLTPLGETFAEASILARKEIFATRIRRLPLFKWLMAMLRAAENQRLKREVIQTALELEYPPERAEQQIETAIAWGRYAEIIAYDDSDEVLYSEPAGMTTPALAA